MGIGCTGPHLNVTTILFVSGAWRKHKDDLVQVQLV